MDQQRAMEWLMQMAMDPHFSDLISDFCSFRGRVAPTNPNQVRKQVCKFLGKLHGALQDHLALIYLDGRQDGSLLSDAISCLASAQEAISDSSKSEYLPDIITVLYILSRHPIGESVNDTPTKRLDDLLTLLRVQEVNAESLLRDMAPGDIEAITHALDEAVAEVQNSVLSDAPSVFE